MKKLVYIFMIAAVLVSCKKNTTETPSPVKSAEVEFDVNSIFEFTDRSYDVPNCNDSLVPTYAKIWLQPVTETDPHVYTEYTAEIYEVDGVGHLYTKALMMDVMDPADPLYVQRESNCYRLVGFVVMGINEVTGDTAIYKATPAPHAEFSEFVVNGIPQEFCLEPFKKTKIEIDVLCFVPDYYDLFGFFWFEITEITIREMCFFGDFCLKDTDIYAGTEYESGGGVFIDEAAIFEIRAKHQIGDGPLVDMVGTPFNNVGWTGIGEPLCVRYPDYDAEVDYYEFELYLWAKVGNTMQWVYLYTFEWFDIFENTYNPGVDGVYEFVVGNCVATPTDMLFPPYMNLPATGQMYLYSPADPGAITGAYWDVEFAGFGAGYDIMTGVVYPGWCGDKWHTIDYYWHDVWFYSTLDDAGEFPASSDLTNRKLEQLNYLFNHFDSHGLDLYPLGLFPTETTDAIQQSIWMVVHDGTSQPYAPGNSLAATMGTEALGSSSIGYKIPPGGDAGVLMFTEGPARTSVIEQLVLVVVDP